MKIKYFIAVAVSLFLIVQADASALRFRLGWVLCAQMSRQEVKIAKWNKLAFTNNYTSKVYAVVTVRMDKKRTLSIHDFSLVQGFDKFPCVAIREGSGDFVYQNKELKTSPDKLYSMLFMLEIPDFKDDKKLEYKLAYNLFKTEDGDLTLEFKNLGSGSFTPVDKIPVRGCFKSAK